MPQQAQSMSRQKPIYKVEDLDCRTCSKEVNERSDMWQEFLGVIRLFHRLERIYNSNAPCRIEAYLKRVSYLVTHERIPPASHIDSIANGEIVTSLDSYTVFMNHALEQIKRNKGPDMFSIRTQFAEGVYKPEQWPNLIVITGVLVPSSPEEFKKVTSLEEFAGFEF